MDPRQFGDALTGQLRLSYLAAVEAALNLLDEDELTRLILRGQQREIVLLVERLLAEGFVPTATRFVEAMLAAATAAGASAVAGAAALERLSPRVLDFVRREGGQRITQLSTETMSRVAEQVAEGIRQGVGAQKLGRQIRDSVGLLASHDRALKKYQANQEALVEEGQLTARRAEKNVATYRQRLLAWRAETIARTEAMRAAHGGLVEGWRANIDAGFLPETALMKWVVTEDDRTCSRCAPMEYHPPVPVIGGMFTAREKGFPDGVPEYGTSLAAQRARKGGIKPGTKRDEWRDTHLDGFTVPMTPIRVPFPPLHPRCRCSLAIVEEG